MAGKKILVVEDERIVARDIEKRLINLGYTVTATVTSGEEAIVKAAETQPDLILMDIRLKRGMDGIEAAEHIRSSFNIPIIFLTAYADENTLQRAKVTEPFGYIIKPFDERDLHTSIEVALRRSLAETAIRVALDKEKELSELKSRFWSIAAHEFRTPMTSILSCAQLLERYDRELPEERRRECLYLIQKSVKAMNQLLDDILSVGRAESNTLKFTPDLVDLGEFCREIVEEMQFNSSLRHQILFNCQGDCGRVYLDRNLLWHILSNLLSNAIKYSPQGGDVTLNLTCLDREIILQVKDRGIGIPVEEQQLLFEPFQRASNVGQIPGTGLGLTMVKKCLDLHRGKILVESSVGQGTTFTIELPVDRAVVSTSHLL